MGRRGEGIIKWKTPVIILCNVHFVIKLLLDQLTLMPGPIVQRLVERDHSSFLMKEASEDLWVVQGLS